MTLPAAFAFATPAAASTVPADAWWRLGVGIDNWHDAARAAAQQAVAETIAALQAEAAQTEPRGSRSSPRRPSTRSRADHSHVDLEVLRAAVSVSDVLRAHGVDVQRERGRIACPLHGGTNPQAFSYDRERWHCFACGTGGDVFALVMALRGCEFREALAVVAELAGVTTDTPSRVSTAELEQRQTIARRRQRRLERLNAWWRTRSHQWMSALFVTVNAVNQWQADAKAPNDEWWDELDDRCTARDRAEAMTEMFAEVRSVEQHVQAFIAEQRGLVTVPWGAASC
jgi:hypothetical protein